MRNIVITGGNAGMGKEAVKRFLENGDRVVFTSRSTEKSLRVLAEFHEAAAAGRLYFFPCDSGREADVQKLAAFVRETLGGCDALINCAGVFVGGMVHEMSEADYDLVMDADVKGVFMTCKHLLPLLLVRGGSLVAVSSSCGVRGSYNCAVYCAAKAAVNNLTRCLALDYGARGVRANAICPSATETDMFLSGTTPAVMNAFNAQNPAGRIGKPVEIANLIFFLCSDEAQYINGQCISVDGGITAWTGEPRQDKTETRR